MTLVELLTTMAILGIVMTGILVMFTSGLRAETDMNNRFRAQQNARLALSALRNEIGSACSASVGTVTGETVGSQLTLVLPNQNPTGGINACSSGTTTVLWCAASPTLAAPYSLYRSTGATCSSSSGVKRVGSLKCAGATAAPNACTAVFAKTISSSTRPAVTVTFPVEANLTNNHGLYTLSDTLTVRNSPGYTLSIAKAATGSGSVSSSPGGIACGSSCSHDYTSGTQVTLSAAAASGSTFAGWSGGGCSGTGTCTVTMSAAVLVTATFTTP
jgi:type II secretory pathway pseudopilin PulG